MNFYMNLNGIWWELYDRKGQLIKLILVDEYDLNEAIRFFRNFATAFCNDPVICEFEEIYRQG